MKPMIGILGGTFDPIHNGHLAMARCARDTLHLSRVLLIPAGSPWQRQPRASADDRLRMTELAICNEPTLEIDDCEIRRLAPTYTIDTLQELRQIHGDDQPFCLILGSDAFLNLTTWHAWKTLLDLTHIVILCRPGFNLPTQLNPESLRQAWLARQTDWSALHRFPSGKISALPMPPMPISSTQIRHALAHFLPAPEGLIPANVLDYIETHQLYRQSP